MKELAKLSILERPIARHFFLYFLLVLFFSLYFSSSVVWNVVICPSKVAGSIVLDQTMDGKASRILRLSRFISAVVAHYSRRVPIAKSTFSCFSDGLTLAPSARSTGARKLAPERTRCPPPVSWGPLLVTARAMAIPNLPFTERRKVAFADCASEQRGPSPSVCYE